MISDEQIALAIGSIIASFAVGYGLSLVNDRRHSKNAKNKSIESMIGELEDIITFETNRKQPIIEINGTKVGLHGASLLTASFDSMLYSRTFRELDIKTQVKISNFYEKIKVSNLLTTKLIELVTIGDATQPQFLKNLQGLGNNMEERLKEHKDDAEELITFLKKIK